MLLFKHTNNVTHVLRLSCFVSSRLSLSSVYLFVVWGQFWRIAAPWLNYQPIIRAWSYCQLGVTFICPFLHISSNINKGTGLYALLWISTRGTFGDIKLHKRVPSNLLRFSLSLHIPHCHNTVDNSYSCSNLLQDYQCNSEQQSSTSMLQQCNIALEYTYVCRTPFFCLDGCKIWNNERWFWARNIGQFGRNLLIWHINETTRDPPRININLDSPRTPSDLTPRI